MAQAQINAKQALMARFGAQRRLVDNAHVVTFKREAEFGCCNVQSEQFIPMHACHGHPFSEYARCGVTMCGFFHYCAGHYPLTDKEITDHLDSLKKELLTLCFRGFDFGNAFAGISQLHSELLGFAEPKPPITLDETRERIASFCEAFQPYGAGTYQVEHSKEESFADVARRVPSTARPPPKDAGSVSKPRNTNFRKQNFEFSKPKPPVIDLVKEFPEIKAKFEKLSQIVSGSTIQPTGSPRTVEAMGTVPRDERKGSHRLLDDLQGGDDGTVSGRRDVDRFDD
jgi:hypothetical protein